MASPGRMGETIKLVEDAPQPHPSLEHGQTLVEVASAGINPADYKLVEIGFAASAITSLPKTPGMDLSGRVVEVAKDVQNVRVGDVVLARLDPTKAPGSLCQRVVVSHDGYAVLPPGFDLDMAAGAPTAALTAYQSIFPYVKAGDKILINGGSGGVGTFGIQVAKALACHVTVSCSTGKKALCKELGADAIIDYKTTDVGSQLQQGGQVYSLVVDNVCRSPPDLYMRSNHLLKPEGTFVFVADVVSLHSAKTMAFANLVPSFLGGGKCKFVAYLTKNSQVDLAQIAKWLGQGTLKTVIEETSEFEDAVEAYSHLKRGSSRGKVIVHVAPAS